MIWLNNAYLYNAKLLQNKLQEEIACYEQTVAVLNKNSKENGMLSLPSELNEIITEYIFYEPVKQLSAEEIIETSLKDNWQCNEHIIQQIIEYTFNFSENSRISFQIYYGDDICGSLKGNVGITKYSSKWRAMEFNVHYGCGKTLTPKGTRLEYDLSSLELIDPSQCNQRKIDCNFVRQRMTM